MAKKSAAHAALAIREHPNCFCCIAAGELFALTIAQEVAHRESARCTE